MPTDIKKKLTDICNKVRSKTGKIDKIPYNNIEAEIESIGAGCEAKPENVAEGVKVFANDKVITGTNPLAKHYEQIIIDTDDDKVIVEGLVDEGLDTIENLDDNVHQIIKGNNNVVDIHKDATISMKDGAKVKNVNPESILEGHKVLGIDGTGKGGIDTSDATAKATDIMPGKTAYVNGTKLTGTATSDANAVASDILSGKTAYVNGVKLTGTGVKGDDTSDATAKATDIMPGKTAYVNGTKLTGTATSDANAVASDILSGKTAYVNGVKLTGTGVKGDDTSDATANGSHIAEGMTAYVDGQKITGTNQIAKYEDGISVSKSDNSIAINTAMNSIHGIKRVDINSYMDGVIINKEGTSVNLNANANVFVANGMKVANILPSDIVKGRNVLGVDGTGISDYEVVVPEASGFTLTGSIFSFNTPNLSNFTNAGARVSYAIIINGTIIETNENQIDLKKYLIDGNNEIGVSVKLQINSNGLLTTTYYSKPTNAVIQVLPTSLTSGGGYNYKACTSNDSIYIFHEAVASGSTKYTYKFDIKTETLTTFSPQTVVYGVCASDEFVYLINDGYLRKFSVDNLQTRIGNYEVPIPLEDSNYICIIYHKGSVIVISKDRLAVFDTTSETFTEIPATSITTETAKGITHQHHVVIGNKVYFSPNTKTGEAYIKCADIETIQMCEEEYIELPFTFESASFVQCETDILILGGNSNAGNYMNTIYRADTISCTTTLMNTTLPVGINKHGAISIGDTCYIFGGKISSSVNSKDIIKISYTDLLS